jgi:hypothetical protein
MLSMFGLEIGLFADYPIDLDVADRVKAFQHGLILSDTACEELPR